MENLYFDSIVARITQNVERFQNKGNRHEKRYAKSLEIVWKKFYRQNLKF